jgi:hypothetical protein
MPIDDWPVTNGTLSVVSFGLPHRSQSRSRAQHAMSGGRIQPITGRMSVFPHRMYLSGATRWRSEAAQSHEWVILPG